MVTSGDIWSLADWRIVFGGIADIGLWSFDADGWCLRHGNPAMGSLAILPPTETDPRPTLAEALWLADCIAFDHDAPVGVRPWRGRTDVSLPVMPVLRPPGLSIDDLAQWAADDLDQAHDAAAELRFGASYAVRYGVAGGPSVDFSRRFAGRETAVSMYAMAARQADVMAEYLLLYRLLEAGDKGNGTRFIKEHLADIATADYGVLKVMPMFDENNWVNAFEVYRARGAAELAVLARRGSESPADVSAYLYGLRNSLAHGRRNARTMDLAESMASVSRALPIVKLLARLVVETAADEVATGAMRGGDSVEGHLGTARRRSCWRCRGDAIVILESPSGWNSSWATPACAGCLPRLVDTMGGGPGAALGPSGRWQPVEVMWRPGEPIG